MKIIFTPDLMEKILVYISNTKNYLYINVSCSFIGKFLTKLVVILKKILDENNRIKIKYVIDGNIILNETYSYINSKLKNYEKFTLVPKKKYSSTDRIRHINIDNKYFFIGSAYFADDMYIYLDAMFLLKADNEMDFNYINKFNLRTHINDEFLYICKPFNICCNNDLEEFVENAEDSLIIIIPYLHSLMYHLRIINMIIRLSSKIKVTFIFSKLIEQTHNLNKAFELFIKKNDFLTKNGANVIHSKIQFHFKMFIKDKKKLLFITGNLNDTNNKFTDVNLKIKNDKLLIKQILEKLNLTVI